MILITGGAGYVGSHFVRAYLTANTDNRAVVIDNLSKGHQEAIPVDGRVKFFQLDIGDRTQIEKILKDFKVDAVVHFAAKAYVHDSQIDPLGYFHNNVVQSLTLFEAMQVSGVRNIVFSSSCALYGLPQYVPLDEEHGKRPVSVYGTTKLMVEQILESLCETLGWSSISLRYFNAAGASTTYEIGESHEPETHLIPNLLKVAKGIDKSVLVYGTDYETRDGTCIRDYVHVDDLASAHLCALNYLKNAAKPQALALNLGTSVGSSVLEVLAVCEEVTGVKIAQQNMPRRDGDSPHLVANAVKAGEILGWKPQIDLNEIVRSAWHWERTRRF
jgi:UDP-glucose 4-epimerase